MGFVVLYAALFVMWLVLGIVTLKNTPISSVSYAAAWGVVLFYLLMDIAKACLPLVG